PARRTRTPAAASSPSRSPAPERRIATARRSVTANLERSPALRRGFRHFGARLYLKPTDIGAAAPGRLPLAGGPLAFGALTVMTRDGGHVRAAEATVTAVREWAAAEGPETARAVEATLERLSAPRPRFAGLAPTRPHLMGIVNATPDS